MFSPAFEALLESSGEILGASINLDGQNNLLFLPNFDIYGVRKVMNFLNRRDEIIKLILQNKSQKIWMDFLLVNLVYCNFFLDFSIKRRIFNSNE